MTRTLAAVRQTPWDCKWSRLGYRLFDMPEERQPETLWVCVGTGQRRGVTEGDCEHCGHWQPQDEVEETTRSEIGTGGARGHARDGLPAPQTAARFRPIQGARTHMTTAVERVSIRLAILAARLVMIIMAAGIAYLGFAVLTTPWSIPLAVGLWLGAAAMLGLGIFDDLRRRARA